MYKKQRSRIVINLIHVAYRIGPSKVYRSFRLRYRTVILGTMRTSILQTKTPTQPSAEAEHAETNIDLEHINLLDLNTTKTEVLRRATHLAQEVGQEHSDTIVRGAHFAYDPQGFYRNEASSDEKKVITTLTTLT